MKQLFFALAFGCISMLGSAQNRVTHMLSTSPNYTKEYNYLEEYFSPQYLISPLNRMDNVDESEAKTTFYKFEIPFHYARELPRNFFLTIGYSRINGEYNSSMTYREWDVSIEKLQVFEMIKIAGGEVSAGIGKAFYFSESKKFMLMPNMRAYFEGCSFDGYYGGGLADSPNPLKQDNFNYYNKRGFTLGLQANYQISKHFGLGLNINNIIGYEKLDVTYTTVYNSDIDEKNFVLNLKQTPQLHLIYYFRGKSRDWVK
jgi:hypothetical protein